VDEELEDELDDDELELDDELDELDELEELEELEELDELEEFEELEELLEELDDEFVSWPPPQATSPILNSMASQPLFIICLITVVMPLTACRFSGSCRVVASLSVIGIQVTTRNGGQFGCEGTNGHRGLHV
jgi:Uncharacterized conserved protein